MKRHLLGSSLIACMLALAACGDDAGNTTPMNDAGNTGDGGTTADMATAEDAATDDMAIAADAALLDMTVTPDAEVSTPIGIGDLPREFAAMLCAKRECILSSTSFGELAALAPVFLGGADAAACTLRATAFLEELAFAPSILAVSNGAATYDAELARTCLNSLIADEGCDVFGSNCFDAVITGSTAEGSPCVLYDGDDYCEAGTVCSGDNIGGTCSDGMCVAKLALGEVCVQDGDCLPPPERADAYGWSRCQNNGGASSVCTHYYNVRTGELGDSCGGSHTAESANVLTATECGDGTYCQEGNCIAEERAGFNEACEGASDDDLDCEEGLVCVGVCKPLMFISTLGADCGDIGDSVALCDPAAGVVCDLNFDTFEGTCVAIGDGTVGSVCAMGIGQILGTQACSSDSYCPDFTDGIPVAAECEAKKADEARCDNDYECLSGACLFDGEGRQCGVPICVI